MNVNIHAGGMLAPKAAHAGTHWDAIHAFLQNHVVAPFKAWRQKRKALEQIARMTERDLADIGFTRADLRNAVLFNRNLRG